jgi:hypothetical protein
LNSRGISLVELLIGVSVAGLVGVLLVSLLTQNSRIYTDQNAKINDGITINNSVAKIEETIKSAAAIANQYQHSGGPLYTTGSSTLVLTQPSINTSGAVIENTYDYLVLSADTQNSKILRLILYPNAQSTREAQNQVLATNMSKLEFRYFNSLGESVSPILATRIGYILNVNQTIATQSQTSSTSGTVNLRNN